MKKAKPRVLCLEHDKETCEILSLVIRNSGYEVVSAHTVGDGVKLAKEGDFVLIIVDSWYEDGSGIDLCKKIREFDAHTPIIFYSADVFPRQIEEALKAGAQSYIGKPVDPFEVEKTIVQLLT